MKIIKKIIIVVLVIFLAVIYSNGTWERAIYDTEVDNYATTDKITNCVQQTFVCPYNGLNGISVKLYFENDKAMDKYQWILSKTSGEIVAEGKFDKSMLEEKVYKKKQIIRLGFSTQKESKNQEYIFSIKNNDISNENVMSCYVAPQSKYAKELMADSNVIEKGMVFKQYILMFNKETFIVFLGLAIYISLFTKFIYKLFE